MRRIQCVITGLMMEAATWPSHMGRNGSGFRSEWPPAESQQGNGDLSSTVTRNWILPTRMSSDLDFFLLEPLDEKSAQPTPDISLVILSGEPRGCWPTNCELKDNCYVSH